MERPLASQPRVAILREQGVNGHVEMAWAFAQAGFCVVDVHMTDLLSKRVSLEPFVGLAACGAGAGAAVAIGAVMPMVSAAAPSVAASLEEKESIG